MATTSRPTSSLDSDSVGDFFRLHGRAVGIVAGGALLAVGATAAWRWNRSSQGERAEAAYFQALNSPGAGENPARAEAALRQVAQGYDGTTGGAQAQMTLAQLLFDQGKYQDGLQVLANASDAPEPLRPGVQLLTAAGYEGLNRFADAAKRYESLAAGAKAETTRDQLLASAARAYTAGNDRANATRLWQQLASRDGAPVADEARVRLGELAAATAR
jgi:lipopolysaccharide biosynthesis regulator YciM